MNEGFSIDHEIHADKKKSDLKGLNLTSTDMKQMLNLIWSRKQRGVLLTAMTVYC